MKRSALDKKNGNLEKRPYLHYLAMVFLSIFKLQLKFFTFFPFQVSSFSPFFRLQINKVS